MPLQTVPCKHGLFTVYDNDYWIGKGLIQTGEYSEPEVQKLLSLVDRDSVVVEVGANIGAISVPLANTVAALHVIEPQPKIFALLNQNIARNCKGRNVTFFHGAVGARARDRVPLVPLDVDAPNINMGGAQLARFDSDDAIHVAQITLDDYCGKFERLDLVKLDVEGMEGDVIDGAGEVIKRFRPILWCENDREEKSEGLIKKLLALGYRLAWCPTPIFNPDPNATGTTFSFNMLCVPDEKFVDPGDDCMPIISAKHDWRLAAQWATGRYALRRAVPKLNKGWACVVRLGSVGDNLIASSVLPYLQWKYGKLEVICAEPYHVIFENNVHIDKLTVKKSGLPGGDGMSWQNYWLDRADDYEFFVNLSHTCEGLRAIAASMTAFYWPAKARRKF